MGRKTEVAQRIATIMRRAPGNLAHLDASLTTLGEAYEFLTMTMIIMQRGWSTAIPDPDRGADVLAFNNVLRNTVPVQVKAARVLTADYRQVHSAARENRLAYQIDISARQLAELDSDPQPFVVWLVREDEEPLALVLDGEIMTAIRACRPGAVEQLNVFFYQSLTDPHDILYHSHVTTANQLRPYVEAWDSCFPRNAISDADRKRMLAAATENLTIHYLLLREGGWTAAKPHPDRGADILALQNQYDISIPCQVKASMVELTSNGAQAAPQGYVPFHYGVSPSQTVDLLRREAETVFVLWMCFTEVPPYRWEPLIFRGNDLIAAKPGGGWGGENDNFWAYATLDPQAATDANNHAGKSIHSICFGGPFRRPIDVTAALDNWAAF